MPSSSIPACQLSLLQFYPFILLLPLRDMRNYLMSHLLWGKEN